MTSPNDVSSSDIPEFDSSNYNMDAATLTSLNLVLRDNQLKIEWPDNVNLFHMTVGQHLGSDSRDRTAMIYEDEQNRIHTQTFAEVDTAAHNLASALSELGFGPGDFIGIHTGQHPDTAIAHMAVCKLGGVAVTLSQLYGPETLRHALNDCRLKVILTD